MAQEIKTRRPDAGKVLDEAMAFRDAENNVGNLSYVQEEYANNEFKVMHGIGSTLLELKLTFQTREEPQTMLFELKSMEEVAELLKSLEYAFTESLIKKFEALKKSVR